ncbi:hypothetical protein QM012_004090 [Aureobasidium pullulans]|uniref:Uncharacterized protein n=1 Tax=Aureobasidium pullulans TaxID=5580 RepID=A0ABR0T703_AURPU
MSSPSKSRRRSSLSAAFDHFRNRCRRTRIDSLLSPPKLDSGTSNDENESFESPSDDEGLPLTTISSDQGSGSGEGDMHDQAESTASRCDSRLPEFTFENCSLSAGSEIGATEDSKATSPDEDNRLVSALGDFTAEATEPEDFGRYLGLARRRRSKSKNVERDISPTRTTETGPRSVDSLSRLLSSDDSASTLDCEIGVPLQRTLARRNLQLEWTTQVQTEPQTQEQSLLQSTYASLDEVVKETVLAEKHEQGLQELRRRLAPPMKTVDGVRLDARPLVRHSGTAAPPHTSLQLCHVSGPGSISSITSESGGMRRQGLGGQPRPQLTSWFSSSSESTRPEPTNRTDQDPDEWNTHILPPLYAPKLQPPTQPSLPPLQSLLSTTL